MGSHWPKSTGGGAHRHHVVTLHVRFILILALVVELAEEVEGHHGVQVDHHCQEADSHHQLEVAGAGQLRSSAGSSPMPSLPGPYLGSAV